jgi:protocatechuate 3,4-dioxygenase beta subunit
MTVFCAVVAVATIGLLAQNQQSPARDTPGQQRAAAAPATGRMSGRVLTADGGRAIRRARVTINAGSGMRVALTDDSGAFEFSQLPAGRYTLNVSKSGFVSISYGQRRPQLAGTPLDLADGQDLKSLDMRLPRGSVVSGHVFDETGEPLPGTMVRVMTYRNQQGNRQLVPVGNGQTDDRGEFRIWGLNPGDYYVSAVNANINLAGPGGRGIPGGPAVAAAAAAAQMRGVVDALAARALVGADAGQEPSDFRYAPTYYPGVASPGEARPVTVGLAAEALGVDFSILYVRTADVSGRVTAADGSPATSGNITLVSDGGGRGGPLGNYAARIQNGTFTVPNVPPGRYTLRAMSGGERGRGRGGRGGDATMQYAAQPVVIDGDTDSVFVALTAGATLSGSIAVQAARTATPPDFSQFRVLMPPADPADAAVNGQAQVQRDGTFTLEGVAPGFRWIRAQGRGWTLKSVEVDGRETIDAPIELRGGQRIAGITLTFTDQTSEVNGTVVDQQGRPLTEYTVLAFPTDSALWRPQARQIMTTRPDQNGKYQLRGLPAGNYYVAAIDPVEQGEWFDAAFLEQQRAGASRLTLGEGEVKSQDVKVR